LTDKHGFDRKPSMAQQLFERDRSEGRTGMIRSWHELTPRQRSAYRAAAASAGLSYSLTTDELVAAPESGRQPAIGA
jgi:hypothetical protein